MQNLLFSERCASFTFLFPFSFSLFLGPCLIFYLSCLIFVNDGRSIGSLAFASKKRASSVAMMVSSRQKAREAEPYAAEIADDEYASLTDVKVYW